MTKRGHARVYRPTRIDRAQDAWIREKAAESGVLVESESELVRLALDYAIRNAFRWVPTEGK